MNFEVKNIQVWGVEEALIRAGYPMATGIPDMKEAIANDLAKRMKVGAALGGSPVGHGDDKFLRQITVGMDIIAPRYWWQQFDTYHHTVKNSMSTMHKGKSLDYEVMANEYVNEVILEVFKSIVETYNTMPTEKNFLRVKANLPEGICLGAGVVTNYAQLKTMYYQRKNHRLPEWQKFCEFIECLPYAVELGVTKARA